VALVTEIDPVGLVRGPAAQARLDQYVNDRPYVASSLTSVAISTAFSSALAGRTASHAERAGEQMRWEIAIPAIACDAGEDLMTRIFAPLGYTLTITRLPLDPQFPQWGQSDVYSLRLEGQQTVKDMLSHLYVLLPVLDNSKHYFVGADETEKLLAHGGAWLAAHPERELIARRYLRYKRPLVQTALDRLMRLMESMPPASAADDQSDASVGEAAAVDPVEQAMGLHELRLNAVLAAAREIGARSLVDLGCGEGRLLALTLQERALTRILGMDVSSAALARARRRLHLDTLPDAQRSHIEIVQGSLLYRDTRLAGFDVATLVEVIEHLDPPRIAAMEQVVFQHARPRRVVVTTPNREYNVRWEALGAERLRHSDHRFEWTRAECRAWAERVASAFGYRMTQQELGPSNPELGAPSQLVIFDRLDADLDATATVSDHLETETST
jgi:3' terminal RNA ribose 2'-O-methyltransferase Hen1